MYLMAETEYFLLFDGKQGKHSHHLYCIHTKSISHCNKARKRYKRHIVWKNKNKTICVHGQNNYVENPRKIS